MSNIRKIFIFGIVVLAFAALEIYHADLFAMMGWTRFQLKIAEKEYDSRHFSSAFRWYKILAEKGDDMGCFYLGRLYEKGFGCEKDLNQAIHWYQQAADHGVPEAQLNLGLIYKKNNNCLCSKYLEMAASQGNKMAQIDLGVMYKNGIGVARNSQKALQLLKEASSQCDPRALYYLALTEEDLGHGAESKKAFDEAYRQFEFLADGGNSGARFALGKMYYAGNGRGKDILKAYFEYLVAARQGNQTAQRWVDMIGTEISDPDKVRIVRDVDSWVSMHPLRKGDVKGEDQTL